MVRALSRTLCTRLMSISLAALLSGAPAILDAQDNPAPASAATPAPAPAATPAPAEAEQPPANNQPQTYNPQPQ